MKDKVAESPSAHERLSLQTDGYVFDGEPRTMLLIESTQDERRAPKAVFSLTISRVDALMAGLAKHRALLVQQKADPQLMANDVAEKARKGGPLVSESLAEYVARQKPLNPKDVQ